MKRKRNQSLLIASCLPIAIGTFHSFILTKILSDQMLFPRFKGFRWNPEELNHCLKFPKLSSLQSQLKLGRFLITHCFPLLFQGEKRQSHTEKSWDSPIVIWLGFHCVQLQKWLKKLLQNDHDLKRNLLTLSLIAIMVSS